LSIFKKIFQFFLYIPIQIIFIPFAIVGLIALQLTKEKKVKVLELDQVATIDVKIETLKKAEIKHD
jgi:hypothetical protein